MQWMVEDVFERRMKQEKRYLKEQMAEQQALLETSSIPGSDELDNLLN